MTPSRRARGTLALGLGLSLAVHAGLGVVATRTNLPGAPPTPDDGGLVELLTLPPDEPDLRLGIERSSARTPAWLGFAEGTPHTAPLSEVEQSALSPDPAGARAVAVVVAQGQREASAEAQAPAGASPPEGAATQADAAPAPESPAVQPPGAEFRTPTAASPPDSPAERVTPDQSEPPSVEATEREVERPGPVDDPSRAPAEPADDAASVDIASDLLLAQVAIEPSEPAPDPLALLADPLPPSTRPESAPTPTEPTPAAPPAEAAPSDATPDPADAATESSKPLDAETKPAVAPSPDDGQGTPQGDDRPIVSARSGNEGDTPGERSPSESSAASTQEPVEVRPGRVVAAEGLQITTVRPQFAVSTMATARPRSPTVLIEFAKDGRVRRARFITGQTTGYADVDQPLLAAVYRWTAAGAPLAALTDDPEDVILVRMRIILR